jgi:hypothetical protein
LSERHYTSSEAIAYAPPPYDAFICGSDQIWNPFICKSNGQAWNEPAYFLTFAPEAKRISYAPSISVPAIPAKLRAEMTALLHEIPYLSTRERQGATLIRELTGREAQVVLDPTLLLSREQWNKVAVAPDVREPYMLAYFLGERGSGDEYRQFAHRLSETTGYRIVLLSREMDASERADTLCCYDAGPAEFLGLVRHASCICTDSFHGTIFAINYGKPFYVFERPGSSGARSMASRIYSVLDMFGLTARLLQPQSPLPSDPYAMDYPRVETILRDEREKSMRYLRNALLSATRE